MTEAARSGDDAGAGLVTSSRTTRADVDAAAGSGPPGAAARAAGAGRPCTGAGAAAAGLVNEAAPGVRATRAPMHPPCRVARVMDDSMARGQAYV